MSSLPDYDIAIVGGGVSGVYSGWRLMTASVEQSPLLQQWAAARGGKLKIAVFEGGQRIGGRLLSARPPGMPHTTCEVGGMRYVSSQSLISSLIEKKLKLPRHEQVVDQPQNLAYLRGQHLRVQDLTNPAQLPYHLRWAEADWLSQKNEPSALIGWAANQLLPGIQDLHADDLEAYLQSAQIDDTPLYQHGFWNLLARAMSMEAYQLSRTTVGYDSLGANANAVDLIAEYFNFTPDVKYYLLDDGYETVPWTLEQKFRKAGGNVFLGHWLEGFNAVSLGDGEIGVSLKFHTDSQETSARAIVLAMPRRSIELLRREGPVLDPAKAPEFQFLLNSVEPIPLYKLFIAYPYPWWSVVGVEKGRSLTDMPLRQCYYWAVEGKQPGADPHNHNAILMAYNDVSNVQFWGGLRRLPLGPDDAKVQTLMGGRRSVPPYHCAVARAFDRKPMPYRMPPKEDLLDQRLRRNWDAHQAPHEMVKEMHRQLIELHNLPSAPEPIEAAFMDWSDDPYGGGVHFWNPGYQSWLLLERMIHPVPDFPCYVVGEAWSTNQTWVEGALQTSEIMLQKHFRLPQPGWVSHG
ncbi:FAD-dependent oxidoreductase [Trichocoleus sp. FACHB-591]|uniref:flavin monoamine oxidase family protein n=1 Tax=Trichocoleus sp. FACHB-591 TaxID=2692872 RepID=UPI0016827F11|nr:FAD-dependent oxidoreductase [Trichocoleus sp. FACHB-591]MBD2098596.1 FAD-dependent oxidoreductase [Trichocoleus sp. FACHB-591]